MDFYYSIIALGLGNDLALVLVPALLFLLSVLFLLSMLLLLPIFGARQQAESVSNPTGGNAAAQDPRDNTRSIETDTKVFLCAFCIHNKYIVDTV